MHSYETRNSAETPTSNATDRAHPVDGPNSDGFHPGATMRFDDSGKVSLDHIYAQPDPAAYFTTLRTLDYRIPQVAKPYFNNLVQEHRDTRHRRPTVLDIGCSYGVNAALLRCDVAMAELYERYSRAVPEPEAPSRSASQLSAEHRRQLRRGELLDRDRQLVRTRGDLERARLVGLDTSAPALSYAVEAGFLDDAVQADLEHRDPTEAEQSQFAGTDIVVSTGCLGYVSERTVARVARAAAADDGQLPWMAHFVLRMFPFGPIAQTLTELGYETARPDGVFKQRRFASAEEQSLVLDTLSTVGVDPGGLEADGWMYAQLYVSRPRTEN